MITQTRILGGKAHDIQIIHFAQYVLDYGDID